MAIILPASGRAQNAGEASGPEIFREQKVYVPYERLAEVLQKKEKGIFIPYSDFIKLWEEATKKPDEKLPPEPPIDAAIIHAEYRGEIVEDMAVFHAELKISALKEKWGRLPLKFKNIAITSASLDGETPLLKPTPGGLELVLPEKRSYLLKLDFSTRVYAAPGKKYIDFQLPSAPLTRIDMTIPGEDLDVEIKPMLSKKIDVKGKNTEFTAFLSPAGKVNVSWLARSLETKSAKSLVFADLFSEFFIRESVYALKSRVDFSVMQAKTDAFRLKIPSGMSLVRVDGKNIKDWETDEAGMLTVTLYEKISGPYTLVIHTEKQRAPDEKTVDFPGLEVTDARRVDGVIVIKTDPSLRVRVEEVDRVARIDPSEIRDKTSLDNLVASYRYLRESFLVRLHVERIQPRVTARQDIVVTFTDAIIDYDSRVRFNVRDAGVFEFKFFTPEGFRVVDVGAGDAVDDFSLTREKGREVLR
ncbi:MAG: hypothetical protein GY859_06755, partial [Desulfobacterales bacterium]|nr:hypothetical protein [Desulfobacterales bacterium]